MKEEPEDENESESEEKKNEDGTTDDDAYDTVVSNTIWVASSVSELMPHLPADS